MEGHITGIRVEAAEKEKFDVADPYSDLKDCKFDEFPLMSQTMQF